MRKWPETIGEVRETILNASQTHYLRYPIYKGR